MPGSTERYRGPVVATATEADAISIVIAGATRSSVSRTVCSAGPS
jgi:hypothetical protein